VLQGDDVGAQRRLGERLKRMALPHPERHGRWTREDERPRHALRQRAHADGVRPAATGRGWPIGHRRIGEVGLAKRRRAGLQIAAQLDWFAARFAG